jgi:L-lactate dehydrogenase complex protein LldG
MASSRDKILKRLRAASVPFEDIEPVRDYLHVAPLPDTSRAALAERFTAQAKKLLAEVYPCKTDDEAIRTILGLIGSDPCILAWDYAHIPLKGLADALANAKIETGAPRDETVRVGLTGVDAALASTGSLLQVSAQGKPRIPSLLPPEHIAVVRVDQIVADFETWVADQRAAGLDRFRAASGVIIISGPSRTADIAMQTTMGMHGPEKVHIILLD